MEDSQNCLYGSLKKDSENSVAILHMGGSQIRVPFWYRSFLGAVIHVIPKRDE